MISEKDYNEIYLKGYEDGKNDNNNLKIHYEIKPSFTTRKLKQLQQENKQLKERIEYLERSNNRREDTILEQRQEISDLEDNWNELKKWLEENESFDDYCNETTFTSVLDKIQELKEK